MAVMRLDEFIAQTEDVDEAPPAIRLGDVKALEPETVDKPGLNALGLPRVTPEQEAAWAAQGEIGYFEQALRQDMGAMVPFSGTIKEFKKNWRLYQAVNRMRQDTEGFTPYEGREGLKAEDGRIITEWNFRMAEEAARGYSIPGNIARGQANLPRFMIEFLVTGGVVSLGGKAISASGSVAAAQLAERVAANYAVKVGVEGVARTAIFPVQGLANAAEKQVIANLEFTEDGLKMAEIAKESPAMSIAKGMGQLYVENVTELLGPAIGSKVVQPVSKLLSGPAAEVARTVFPRKFTSGIIKSFQRMRPNESVTKLFSLTGFHGFVEELGEEYVGGIVNAALGLDVIGTDVDNPVDRIIGALTNGEEMLVAAGVLALPGATRVSINTAVNYVREQKRKAGKPADIQQVPPDVQITDEQLDEIEAAAAEGRVAQFQPENRPPVEGQIEGTEEIVFTLNQEKGTFSLQINRPDGGETTPQRTFEILKQEVAKTGIPFREFMSQYGAEGFTIPLEKINEQGKIEVIYIGSFEGGTHLVGVPTEGRFSETTKEFNPAIHEIVGSRQGVAVPQEVLQPLTAGVAQRMQQFREELAQRLSRVEKNIAEKIGQLQDNAEQVELAQEALGYLNEVRDFVKRSIRVDKDSPIAEELRDLPLYYRSRKGAPIDEVLQELRTQFPGLDIKSDVELVDFLVNLENQRAQVAELVAELREETRAHRIGTILKQRLKDIRAGIREGRIKQRAEAQRVAREIEALLKRSGMPVNAYKKFLPVLRKVDTVENLIRALPEIERRVNVEVDRGKRNRLKVQIKKALEKTAPKVKKGVKQGKFTAFIQDALDTLVAAHKLKAKDAQTALDNNLNDIRSSNTPGRNVEGEKGAINTIDPDLYSGLKILQNRMLQYKADPSSLTVEQIQELLETINALKEGGRAAANVREIKLLAAKQERLDKTREVLNTNPEVAKQQSKTFPRTLENIGANFWYWSTSWTLGWNNLMARLNMGVKGIKMGDGYLSQEFNVLKPLLDQALNTMSRIKQIQDIYKTIYAVKGRPLSEWEFNTQRAKDTVRQVLGKYTYTDKAGNVVTKILEVSRGEAIQIWMHLQNPDVKAQYSELMGINEVSGAIKLLNDFLTDQDRQYGQALIDLYGSSYKEFNALVSKMTGVNLKRHENYSPIYRRIAHKSGEVLTSVFEQVFSGQKLSSMPKASKARVSSTQLEFAPMNATDAAMQYFAEVEHYLATAEKMREIAEVFNNRGIQELIKNGWGKSVLKHTAQFVDKFITNGKATGDQVAIINFIMNNYVISSIAAKPAVMVKQFMSFPAFADNLPLTDFAAGLVDFALDPVGKYKFLSENSILMQTRGYRWTPGLDEALNSIEFKQFMLNPTFINWTLAMPRFGDRMGIVIGGWPTYRYHREVLGKSHEESIAAFEEAANSSQQSSLLSEMSSAQTGSSWMRAFTRFLSAPNQYFRKEVMAIEAFRSGQMDLKQFLKTMAIYHIILPVMFQMAADMFLDLDDDKKYKLRAALLGSLNGYFIMGQIATGIITQSINAFADKDDKKMRVFEQEGLVPQAINQVNQMGGDIFKFFEEPSLAQVFEVVKELGETGQYLTPFPTPEVINIVEGIQQMNSAESFMDYVKGLGQVAGWSDYVLNDALADKKGSKKTDPFNDEVIDVFQLFKKDSKDFNRVLKDSVDYKELFDKL